MSRCRARRCRGDVVLDEGVVARSRLKIPVTARVVDVAVADGHVVCDADVDAPVRLRLPVDLETVDHPVAERLVAFSTSMTPLWLRRRAGARRVEERPPPSSRTASVFGHCRPCRSFRSCIRRTSPGLTRIVSPGAISFDRVLERAPRRGERAGIGVAAARGHVVRRCRSTRPPPRARPCRARLPE